MKKPEALRLALEALEMSRRFVYADNRPQCDEAIDALRAALAQQDEPAWMHPWPPVRAQQAEPVQEPVAWLIEYDNSEREVRFVAGTRGITQTPLYAAAPTAEPVAWMTDRKEMYFDKDDALRYSDSIIKPLYTSPPLPKPLAEWQINDLMAGIDPEDVCSWSFRQGVYAAEKHHGVKP